MFGSANSYRLHHMMAALLVALLLASSSPAACQVQHRDKSQRQLQGLELRRNVQLVLVPVTVKDRRGHLLPSLTQGDFRIIVDGQERPVKYFSNEIGPLAVVVLVDTGLSVSSVNTVRNMLPDLQNCFLPQDVSEAYTFDETIHRLVDFTSQPETWGRR